MNSEVLSYLLSYLPTLPKVVNTATATLGPQKAENVGIESVGRMCSNTILELSAQLAATTEEVDELCLHPRP